MVCACMAGMAWFLPKWCNARVEKGALGHGEAREVLQGSKGRQRLGQHCCK
jgi:hypothetical protein